MFFTFNRQGIISYSESNNGGEYIEMGLFTNVWVSNNELKHKKFETPEDSAIHAVYKEWLGNKKVASFKDNYQLGK